MRTRRIPEFARPIAAILAGALALLTASCVFEGKTGLREGGGSETTLSGRVVDAAGAPVSGAAIRIRPQGDLPPNLFSAEPGEAVSVPQAFSGPDGLFRIQGLASGSYFVECRVARGLAAVVPAELRPEDSLRLPDAVIRPTGAIKGRIVAPLDSNQAPLNPTYVYLLGIWKRGVARDSTGNAFLLTDIPAGTYTLRAQSAFPYDLARFKILEIGNLAVAPGDTLDLDSLVLPARMALRDSVYSRDSAAAAAFLRASRDSGEEFEPGADLGGWVQDHFAVNGNRITMFYDFSSFFHRIPENVLALDALEYIRILGHPSFRMEIAPELSNLPNLKFLYCELCGLDGFPAWTGTFPALRSLGLSSLKSFPEWVYDIPSLVYLGLGDSLTTVPKGISRLKNLRGLGLGRNQISVFPSELMRMPSLQGVDLRYNRLCRITAEERAWILRQDSIVQAEEKDPLRNPQEDTLSWEETQQCDP